MHTCGVHPTRKRSTSDDVANGEVVCVPPLPPPACRLPAPRRKRSCATLSPAGGAKYSMRRSSTSSSAHVAAGVAETHASTAPPAATSPSQLSPRSAPDVKTLKFSRKYSRRGSSTRVPRGGGRGAARDRGVWFQRAAWLAKSSWDGGSEGSSEKASRLCHSPKTSSSGKWTTSRAAAATSSGSVRRSRYSCSSRRIAASTTAAVAVARRRRAPIESSAGGRPHPRHASSKRWLSRGSSHAKVSGGQDARDSATSRHSSSEASTQ